MDISIKSILTLDDDNEYVVVGKAIHENETYFYLVDINSNQLFKILRLNKNNGKLAEFSDQKTVRALIPLFAASTTTELNSLMKEG